MLYSETNVREVKTKGFKAKIKNILFFIFFLFLVTPNETLVKIMAKPFILELLYGILFLGVFLFIVEYLRKYY